MVSWRGNGTQMQQWEWQGHNNMRHCSQRNRGFYQASDGYRGFWGRGIFNNSHQGRKQNFNDMLSVNNEVLRDWKITSKVNK